MERKEIYIEILRMIHRSRDCVRWDLLNAACIQALLPLRIEMTKAEFYLRALAKQEGITLFSLDGEEIPPFCHNEQEITDEDWGNI